METITVDTPTNADWIKKVRDSLEIEKQVAASGGEGGSPGAFSTSTPGVFTPTFGGDQKKKEHERLIRSLNKSLIDIKGNEYNVELALTPEEWSIGLSCRESLPFNNGMLFIFPTEDVKQFHTENVNFPLDILSINSNYQIIHILESISPNSTMISLPPCKYVLELLGGTVQNNDIKIGDGITTPLVSELLIKSDKILKCHECDQDCNCVKNNGCDCDHLDCSCPEIYLISNLKDGTEDIIIDLEKYGIS